MAKEGILLESGTNEVEILEFVLNDQNFGVNVLKIQAIEQYDPARVTHIQLSHPSVIGTLLFRDSCITLVDLGREMDPGETVCRTTRTAADTDVNNVTGNKLVLVMEFNNLKTAFLVHGVNRIHRVSWGAINPLSAFLNTSDSKFTGSMQIEDREILIVDMEKIVTEILPKGQLQHSVVVDESSPHFAARAGKSVFLAEDSAVIREKVTSELRRSNYIDLKTFANGKECFDEITRLNQAAQAEGRPISDYIDVLISDIEMPAMDGLALCKAIKSNPTLREVPVIMFSSLINEQIARKCEDVRSDAHITKPQFAELVDLLDRFTAARDTVPA